MKCHRRIYGAEFSSYEIEHAVETGRLLTMEIEFSRKCNFNCVYCYASNNSKNELTKAEIKDVILQAKDLGARKIIILGGEPTIYPHFMEMVDFIARQDLRIEIFTNGARITESAAKALHEYGVAVVLKTNTAKEELQDMLSGHKGAYKQIQRAFKNLKKAGYPSDRPMGISTVICRQNIDELVPMWVRLREQNILPYYEMITPQGNAKRNGFLDVETERIHELFSAISEIDRTKYGYEWDPQPPLVGGKCLRHQFSCVVNSDGSVMPCVGVTIPVGNIRERKLGDILRDSEVVQDLRNYRQNIKGPCAECAKIDQCYGCRGAAYQITGDYLASDPLCWKNMERQEEIVRLPLEADKLVPHKPPMLILKNLVEVKERMSVSEVEIERDTIFAGRDGKLDAAFYPEIISQSIAAQDGFRSLGNGRIKLQGLLLGIKNLEILGSAGIGDKLRVSVYKVARYGEFGIIRGEVFKGDNLVARGEIKVLQGEKLL
ncbi:MAG: radical SAM protein [Pseudomonadota bacterium]